MSQVRSNKKGHNRRAMFLIESPQGDWYKCFPYNNKKDKRRVDKFKKKYFECRCYFDLLEEM